MTHFALEQGSSVATMLAVAAVAVLLTATFYLRAFRALGARQWWTLLGLRVTAIAIVVLLLFRPVLSYQDQVVERPGLVLLLDRSASMSISDDAAGQTRFEQARDILRRWCDKLKPQFRLRVVAFAERPAALKGPEGVAQLKPDGPASSLARAIQAGAEQFAPAEMAGMVLLSDGRHNAIGNPLDVARKLQKPVYCVGVGASLRSNPSYRDVRVTDITCPDRMLVNNLARITGAVDAVGLGGRVLQVYLDEDGRQTAQTEVTLDDSEGAQQVKFEFRPQTKGRHTYTVRMTPGAEDRIAENNQRSAAALVGEAGIRVLYVEGTLRAEYGALVDRFLAKDPDLEFCALVQTRPNVFLQRTNMTDLKLTGIPAEQGTIDKFDVFIFGDIDSSYFRSKQQEMFVNRVRAGAGAMMLGGYHSLGPGGYGTTPLGHILPLELGDRKVGQGTAQFLPRLTPEGVRHPIFANIAEFFPTQQGEPKTPGLPLLNGCTRVLGARPAGAVLATYTDEKGAMPVLAVQPVDRGRTAVFAADTTRKWQQGPQALGQESPFLRFWGQTVRWLAGRDAAIGTDAGIVVNTDKASYEPGEPVQITAIVRDKSGQGAAHAAVNAKLTLDGQPSEPLTLTAVPGPSGHYSGSIEPRMPGAYQIVGEARSGETTLTSEPVTVDVGRPNLEFENLDLDDKLLGQIAGESGGQYVPVGSADYLLEQLDRAQRKKTRLVEQRLYWPPGFWAAFVGVLALEWTLRRRYQLR